jgi:hypothetical protein
MTTVAALYVAKGGCYFGLEGVDPWDEARDARLYDGPWPVVAHPPCARWSMLAGLVEARYGHKRGEDGGCFAAALEAVRRWGGVLEHPAESAAWRAHGLMTPPRTGGWVSAGLGDVGWTCCVEQGHYGHRARKATWLYAAHVELPRLRWGASGAQVWCSPGVSKQASRGKTVEVMCRRERLSTPPAFRDLLLSIARTARGRLSA